MRGITIGGGTGIVMIGIVTTGTGIMIAIGGGEAAVYAIA